ncbi:MAG TPA: hypothetical protein H9894_10265 [Candidatus Desulfovibrio intestinipullorum]|uniref:Uncharacterized protein n=1 Tax=Candidatus Desulfovibrio intestinipullorum TaxID=2838536 RepID=A0A9D1TRJ2_9BACT|nr:hypothetical protein [Candidatus Desulfovibrio intestinipullorum]
MTELDEKIRAFGNAKKEFYGFMLQKYFDAENGECGALEFEKLYKSSKMNARVRKFAAEKRHIRRNDLGARILTAEGVEYACQLCADEEE